MIQLLPLADYPAGSHTSAEIDLADDVCGYKLDLFRCTDNAPDVWSDAEQSLGVKVEILLENEWLAWGAFEAFGGKHVRRDGSIAETSYLIARISRMQVGRKLRMTLTAAAPVRTGAVLELG